MKGRPSAEKSIQAFLWPSFPLQKLTGKALGFHKASTLVILYYLTLIGRYFSTISYSICISDFANNLQFKVLNKDKYTGRN